MAACGNQPPVPDWQQNAHGAAERASAAYLAGNDRVAAQEWQRARAELAANWDRLRKQYQEALPHIVSLDEWEKTFGISSDQDEPQKVNAERA